MSFASLIESQTHFKLKDNEEYQKKLSFRNTYKDLYDDLYLDVESTLDNEYDTYYSEEFIANIQSNLQSCARRMAWIATSLNDKKEELKVINKKFFKSKAEKLRIEILNKDIDALELDLKQSEVKRQLCFSIKEKKEKFNQFINENDYDDEKVAEYLSQTEREAVKEVILDNSNKREADNVMAFAIKNDGVMSDALTKEVKNSGKYAKLAYEMIYSQVQDMVIEEQKDKIDIVKKSLKNENDFERENG